MCEGTLPIRLIGSGFDKAPLIMAKAVRRFIIIMHSKLILARHS